MDEFLTAHEAAKAIGLNYSTLLARIRKGKITAIKRGWAVFVHKDEVRRVINEGNSRPLEESAR